MPGASFAPPPRPYVRDVLEAVKRADPHIHSELVGKRRTKQIVQVRRVAVTASLALDYSLTQVSAVFDLDHTSVMHHRDRYLAGQDKGGPDAEFEADLFRALIRTANEIAQERRRRYGVLSVIQGGVAA